MEARSRRRISSLSVTYQEELHRPRPYELAAHSNNPFPPRPVPSALLVQGDQSLEHLLLCNVPGAELTGHSPQDGSFYSSISVSKPQPAPNLLLRAPAPVPSSSSRQCDCLPPPPYPCSHHWSCSAPAALHGRTGQLTAPSASPTACAGLEEALRMRLNQEMESFRASLHQLLCAQFTQHRLQSLRHCLLPCQPLAGDNVRCSFQCNHFLRKSNFSDFGQKPWTIVHGFIFGSRKKVVRKVYHLKGNGKRNPMTLVSVA